MPPGGAFSAFWCPIFENILRGGSAHQICELFASYGLIGQESDKIRTDRLKFPQLSFGVLSNEMTLAD